MGVAGKRIATAALTVGAVALIGAQVGSPARADTPPAQPGVATAGAALIGVVPGVSGLTLTTTYGEAEAAYEETQSEATSATVDLGGLGFFLANEPTCGNTVPEKDQPQPLKANSGAGASSPSNALPGVAEEQVSVNPNPEQAQATTSLVSASLPNIISVKGVSTASVHYQANSHQEADATVTADVSLLGGLVDLDGATWTAGVQTGSPARSTGSFSLGKVTIGGTALSLPSVSTAAIIGAINQAIGLLGFSVSLPATTSDKGSVTVGPLVLHFSGSSIDRTAVNPVVDAVTNLEAALKQGSKAGQDCTQFPELLYNVNNQFNTLVNLTLAISRGAGSININLGGANASVSDLPTFVDPFGTVAPGANPLSGSTGPGSSLPGDGSGGPVGSASSGDLGGGSDLAGLAAVAGTGALQAGRGSTQPPGSQPRSEEASAAGPSVCRTTSPAGSPGCWRGPATVAGALLLAGGGAVMAADVAYGHRRRRGKRTRLARREDV